MSHIHKTYPGISSDLTLLENVPKEKRDQIDRAHIIRFGDHYYVKNAHLAILETPPES